MSLRLVRTLLGRDSQYVFVNPRDILVIVQAVVRPFLCTRTYRRTQTRRLRSRTTGRPQGRLRIWTGPRAGRTRPRRWCCPPPTRSGRWCSAPCPTWTTRAPRRPSSSSCSTFRRPPWLPFAAVCRWSGGTKTTTMTPSR